MSKPPAVFCRFLMVLIAGATLDKSALAQADSAQLLPSLPPPHHQDVPAFPMTRFDVSSLPEGTFGADASGDPGTMQTSDHHGVVRNAIRRTLEDQKELYLTPFKESNFKWDVLELAGTGGLIAADRHIEKHIGNAHYQFYQDTSNIAIGGLSAALAGVWIYGLKTENHRHARETGFLELETLVDTFLIYTPMQFVAARQRPGEGNGNGDFWKHHMINTSFPGGHAMFTYAMATVLSHEYSQKWVQVLAYSAASIVTVSRFMARDHWSSDMFIGSALGIGIGAHVFHAHCNPELSDSCKHHTRFIF
ncbi:MAG: phosphatase PAP2 family protein [Acidobacteriota bacterium]